MAVAQDDRPQFYQGQYIGPDDLAAGVEYSRIQQARHALGAHAWGIAIGQQLLEKPSAAGANQVDLFIQPGYSWDGFGRPLVVLAPYKLPPSLFQSITFDQAQDGGNPSGRLVKIWLQFREAPYQLAATGFAACDATGNTSRVQETFQVQVGEPSGSARDAVSIGGLQVDAQNALTAFDPTAPPLYDASVPQQAIPDDNPTALWLIPIGYVRWLPSQNPFLAGSFQKRNAQDLQASESLRQYIGVVAGSVLAAGSNVRVRARGTLPSGVVSDDLLWVEGKARIQDDLRLFGSKLSFLDAGGQDEGVPLSIQRFDQSAPQASGLQAVIGKANKGQNSLAIGTLDPKNAFSPLVTFFDNGQVGIGTATPDRLLTLQSGGGTYLNVKDSADKLEVLLGADTNGGIVSTMTNHDLVLRAGGNADKMILKANGRVGVATDSPETSLHVAGTLGIRQNSLFMSGDTGWSSFSYNAHHDQFNGNWVFPDPTHSAVTIEMDDAGGRPRFQVFSTSPAAKATWVDRLHVEGDTGNVYTGLSGGNTGIGTQTPDGKLTVSTPTQGIINLFSATADFEYDGGVDGLFVFHAKNARTAFQGGSIGIGTTTPQTLLDVAGVVTANGFAPPSDVNLKRDIEPLKDALKALLKLRGVRFQWKDPDRHGHGAQTGFIAQEVETVFPEWIIEGAGGQKLMRQEGQTAVIVEAIRELKSQVDALCAKVTELNSQRKTKRKKREP